MIDDEARTRKLNAGLEVARRYVDAPQVEAVYIGGSLVAGLGTPTSDVDLFVIHAPGAAVADEPTQIRVGDERVDVEFRPSGWMTELLETVVGRPTTAQDMTAYNLADRHHDQLVRLSLSNPVLESDEYRAVRQAVVERSATLRHVLIGKWTVRCTDNLQDCLGALAMSDLHTAALLSATLLAHATQAFLAGADRRYLSQKWVPQQLRQAVGDAAPAPQILALLGLEPAALAGVSVRDLVDRRIVLAQALLAAALYAGWSTPDATQWTVWDTDRKGVSRSPRWLPIRFEDGVLLGQADGRQQLKVTERALLIWGLCQGRSPVAVAEAAAAADPSLNPDSAAELLRGLIGLGVVRED